MASSNPGYTHPQSQPNRLPKLSYRSKTCDTESVSSVSTGLTVSTTPTSPLHSSFCSSPRSPPSEMSPLSSPRQSSFAPSSMSSKTSSNHPKKRSNFLAGLFNVREPSAQALEDYQRRLTKQGGGKSTPVGISGVSSAKLPATVPKVNSKWDGVPQTSKEKQKQQDAAGQSMSGLRRQLGNSKTGGSEYRSTSAVNSSCKRLSRGTIGGASMKSVSSNNLAELYGWETSSSHSGSSAIDFAAEHRPTSSRAVSSWSAPPLQQNSSFHPHDPAPSPAISFPPLELCPPSRLGSPNLPALSYSPMLTPSDALPATPDAPSPSTDLVSKKLEAISQENTKITLLDAPGSAEDIIVKSAGVNILGPPAAAKRKPRLTPLQPGEGRPKTSRGEFQSSSILRREAPVQKNTPSPRPALASYFPNTMRTPSSNSPPAKVPVRHNFTRERLGLGVSLKNQVAASSQSPQQATDVDAEGERIHTPTPEGGKFLRRKSRMALFKN